MRFQFCKTAILVALVMVLALAYPLYAWASPEILRAVVASGIIAFANVLIACVTLELSIDKSHRVFMSAVFGGMGIRIGLILVAVTILLINDYHPLALTLSLMGFYIVFMIVEIVYAMRELARRNPRTRPAGRTRDRHSSLRSFSIEHRSN